MDRRIDGDIMHPDRFPSMGIDRNRTFDPLDYPHQPSEYHPTDHFWQKYHEKERFLSGEVIARTIACGSVKDMRYGRVCFSWKRQGGGVRWFIWAAHHVDGYRIILTGWPYLAHRRSALSSGWTEQELDAIEAFNREGSGYEPKWSDEWAEYAEWSKNHPAGGSAIPA